MEDSVSAFDRGDQRHANASRLAMMATYMPSLGARAPLFVRTSSAFEYAAAYLPSDYSFSPRPAPANPPVTPWGDADSEDGRASTGWGYCLAPTQSPVNMLLAADLSEVIQAPGGGNPRRDGCSDAVLTARTATPGRWPYLKQQAARHVYGNLRARLSQSNRADPAAAASASAASTTAGGTPRPPEDDPIRPQQQHQQPVDGMRIQPLGIRSKGERVSEAASPKDGPRRDRLGVGPRGETKTSYRVSLKEKRADGAGSMSAPVHSFHSSSLSTTTTTTKVSSGEGAASSNAGPANPQPRRSRTAREHYRPKRGPLVRFEARELPARLQHHSYPDPASTNATGGPSSSHIPSSGRVTWADVMAAESSGVYREPSGSGGGRDGRAGGPAPPGDDPKASLYLSSELWEILDEDMAALKSASSGNG